ncbi:MAG: chloride channel protein [Armatimonadetes bacterium]|nr:chloride channel protein [Armatimonadota bacterium]
MRPRRQQPSTVEWVQPMERLLPRPAAVIAMAVVVGLVAGFGAVIFRWMIALAQRIFLHGLAGVIAPALGDFRWILIPAAGGLFVGPIVHFFAREAKGHGVPQVMEAVYARGGRIRPRVVFAEILASSITIGSGGAAGREGPIVLIGSTMGSIFGQLFRMPPSLTRLLVACGAAGGVAATFNAPIAGPFFALELILRDWGAASFAPVVVSSFCATVVGRYFLGDHPAFSVPPYSVAAISELPMFALLGAIAALVGIAFIVVLYAFEDTWANSPIPGWLQPFVGGLFVGLLGFLSMSLFGSYENPNLGIFGVGYDTMHLALSGSLTQPAIVFGLLLLKILATSITLGSGGSGGVFAPSLFMGCMAGAVFGLVADTALPWMKTTPAAYALVGMGAVFAAAARAPVTSVIIVYEITQDYRMILPLMLAVAVSVVVANSLFRFSIYNVKLVRRGIHFDLAREPALLNELTVADAMTTDVVSVRPTQHVSEVLQLFEETKHHGFPVVDESGKLHGIVTIGDVRRALIEGKTDAPISEIATHDLVVAFPDESLNEALLKLGLRDVGRLPVVSREDHTRLVGLVTRKNILSAYGRALLARHTGLHETVRPEHFD